MWGNPVVLLAEAAPAMPADYWREGEGNADALRIITSGMRSAATITHPSQSNSCYPGQPGYVEAVEPPNRPLWPMGMTLWVLVGGGSLAVATWKLVVPIRRLGTGTRISLRLVLRLRPCRSGLLGREMPLRPSRVPGQDGLPRPGPAGAPHRVSRSPVTESGMPCRGASGSSPAPGPV